MEVAFYCLFVSAAVVALYFIVACVFASVSHCSTHSNEIHFIVLRTLCCFGIKRAFIMLVWLFWCTCVSKICFKRQRKNIFQHEIRLQWQIIALIERKCVSMCWSYATHNLSFIIYQQGTINYITLHNTSNDALSQIKIVYTLTYPQVKRLTFHNTTFSFTEVFFWNIIMTCQDYSTKKTIVNHSLKPLINYEHIWPRPVPWWGWRNISMFIQIILTY